jgi:oligosaccharyl transferase complex subunit OST4
MEIDPAVAKKTLVGPYHTIAAAAATMISDDDLYRLAIFLGSAAMLLIILYHFLETNAKESAPSPKSSTSQSVPRSSVASSEAGSARD